MDDAMVMDNDIDLKATIQLVYDRIAAIEERIGGVEYALGCLERSNKELKKDLMIQGGAYSD